MTGYQRSPWRAAPTSPTRRHLTRPNLASASCPNGLCGHPITFHDRDEIPWPRIERCQVPDCDCVAMVTT